MTTLDDTVGYQSPSNPYAQYALQEKTVPTFTRNEIPDTMDTTKDVSDNKCHPSKSIGNVSITDHNGAFVGHVLASTNTSLQVRQQASNRIRIKGFVDAITSSASNGLSLPQYAPHVASSSGKKEELFLRLRMKFGFYTILNLDHDHERETQIVMKYFSFII